MGLLPPGGSIAGGSIKVDDRELVGLRRDEMRRGQMPNVSAGPCWLARNWVPLGAAANPGR
jgi:hypothetical protein